MNWLAAAAAADDCSLDEAGGSTRDSCIRDMLNCSKLSGAGDGTFSKVPDVDRTSDDNVCMGGRGLTATGCWLTFDVGSDSGFSFDPPETAHISTHLLLCQRHMHQKPVPENWYPFFVPDETGSKISGLIFLFFYTTVPPIYCEAIKQQTAQLI